MQFEGKEMTEEPNTEVEYIIIQTNRRKLLKTLQSVIETLMTVIETLKSLVNFVGSCLPREAN